MLEMMELWERCGRQLYWTCAGERPELRREGRSENSIQNGWMKVSAAGADAREEAGAGRQMSSKSRNPERTLRGEAPDGQRPGKTPSALPKLCS